MKCALRAIAVCLSFLAVTTACRAQEAKGVREGQTRLYYVAADEVDWDFAPGGVDAMTGRPFEGMVKAYTERGPHRIGRVYRKALYRDGTSGQDKLDDAVPPGGTYTFVWPVLGRSGPGPNDPSSLVWMYHCHVSEHMEVGMMAHYHVMP